MNPRFKTTARFQRYSWIRHPVRNMKILWSVKRLEGRVNHVIGMLIPAISYAKDTNRDIEYRHRAANYAVDKIVEHFDLIGKLMARELTVVNRSELRSKIINGEIEYWGQIMEHVQGLDVVSETGHDISTVVTVPS